MRVSIILWKADGAPLSPNGITWNWNKPLGVVKAVFALSFSDIGTCQYPLAKSRVVIYFAFPSLSSSSSVLSIYASMKVHNLHSVIGSLHRDECGHLFSSPPLLVKPIHWVKVQWFHLVPSPWAPWSQYIVLCLDSPAICPGCWSSRVKYYYTMSIDTDCNIYENY